MNVTSKKQGNTNKITFVDFDKLNLKSFAENLFQIMEKGVASSVREQGAYTISLNAEFGNGKTTFLKMFEDCVKQEKQDYNVLFINAWESDFYREPVIAILSEFISYIEGTVKKENDKVKKEIINQAFRVISNITNQVVQNKIGFNINEIIDSYKENSLKKKEIIGKSIVGDFLQRKEAIKKIRKIITEHIGNKKLLIIVDELDRTRPDYAVCFLEDMKHFFDIRNVVFLIAVNRKQMEATAKCLYGQNLDFDGYYRKFFKQEINLPDPYKEAQRLVDGLIQNTNVKYRYNTNDISRQYRVENSYLSCKIFRLTLREIEYFIRIFEILVGSKEHVARWDYMDCCSFFICLFLKEKKIFQKILDGNFTIHKFIQFIDKNAFDFKLDEEGIHVSNTANITCSSNFLLGIVACSLIRGKEFQTEKNIIIKKFPVMDTTVMRYADSRNQLACDICRKINQFKSAFDR